MKNIGLLEIGMEIEKSMGLLHEKLGWEGVIPSILT
jgi:hypothetical protein